MDEKLKRFSEEMEKQLVNNSRKGSIYDFKDFEGIITELEYHKAKMMIAIRMKNFEAVKEYIADSANFLLALGNLFKLYDEDTESSTECYELNKTVDIFTKINVNQQSDNQKIF
jgi:hypothetical protein